MNTAQLAGVIGFALWLTAAAGSEGPRHIDVQVLGSDDTVVVGRLGHPLGTVVVVEASLEYSEHGDLGPSYSRMREYRLRVYRVNGTQLPKTQQFSYRNDVGCSDHGLPDGRITIPPREQNLSEEALYWKGVREETSDTRHILFVHEEAEFSGIPTNLPPGMRIRLSGEWDFAFFTSLVVHHEDAVTRFKTSWSMGGLRRATWPGRAPADKEEFYRGPWSATLDNDPWITTQPAELARVMRAEFVAAAEREGAPALTIERGLEAWAQAAHGRTELAVPASMILMAEETPSVWVVVWKEFRWSDGPEQTGEARAQPSFGTVRWATSVADHCAIVRADDAQVLHEFELYRFSEGE